MPTFTLKKLFASVTMVCFGAAVIAILRQQAIHGAEIHPAVFVPAWFGGGALIGAGAMLPLGRWWLGIVTVWLIQILSRQFVLGGNYYIFGGTW